MPYHVLLCDDYIDLFIFVSYKIIIQLKNDTNWKDVIISRQRKHITLIIVFIFVNGTGIWI